MNKYQINIKKLNIPIIQIKEWKKEEMNDIIEMIESLNELEELYIGIPPNFDLLKTYKGYGLNSIKLFKSIKADEKIRLKDFFRQFNNFNKLTTLTFIHAGINDEFARMIGKILCTINSLTNISFAQKSFCIGMENS